LLEIARRDGIQNVAIHTAETISRRDQWVEADKIKMYYDNLARSFGFKKQRLDVGELRGNFWVRRQRVKRDFGELFVSCISGRVAVTVLASRPIVEDSVVIARSLERQWTLDNPNDRG
jgi:hypothetical protein